MLKDVLSPWSIVERLAITTKPAVIVADADILQSIREMSTGEGALLLPVDRILQGTYFTPLPGPYFVVTRHDEMDIKRRLRQQLAAQGVYPDIHGVFHDLIPALVAERDRPVPGGGSAALESFMYQPAFAIVCTPRCGSQYLSRELYNVGLGQSLEHIRPPVIALLKARAEGQISGYDFTQWFASLVRDGSVNGVFGTKLISHFLRDLRRYCTPEEWETFQCFLKRVPLIYLIRSNKLMQALSRDRAKATRNYHLFDESKRSSYQDSSQAWSYDFNRIASEIRSLNNEELFLNNLILEFAKPKGVIVAHYENFSTESVATKLGQRLGIGLKQIERKLDTSILRDELTFAYKTKFIEDYRSIYVKNDEKTHLPVFTKVDSRNLKISVHTDPKAIVDK